MPRQPRRYRCWRRWSPSTVRRWSLKSDNGSAFISQRFAEWLAAWQIVPLFSPVRMPRYNGACEAGIGGMKRRTELIAARHDRLLDWTCDDLFAALVWANEDHYPHGLAAGTAASRFAARAPLGAAERDTFRAAVVQSEQELYDDRLHLGRRADR